jgi:ABC-type transport system substrate-binding protein
MRDTVRHVTRFAYESPITESVMEVRMQPRSDAMQRCVHFSLTSTPASRVMMYQDPDGNTVLYQTCSGPMNMGKYCDKEVDVLHEQARSASDLAARNAAYEKLAARFLQNGWIIYLYHPQYLIASTDRVEGFKPMPDGLLRVVGVKLK